MVRAPARVADSRCAGDARGTHAPAGAARHDPGESRNVWAENVDEGSYLFKNAIEFLRSVGTAEKFVKPREESLAAFAAAR